MSNRYLKWIIENGKWKIINGSKICTLHFLQNTLNIEQYNVGKLFKTIFHFQLSILIAYTNYPSLGVHFIPSQ